MLEEGAVEQALGRPGRIGTVDDHHVVAGSRGIGHPGDAITDGEVQARVAPGAAADGRQVPLAQFHHQPIDLHQIKVADLRVAQAFTGGAAVTAADHQHPFDAGGAAEGRVHD